jgi:hypothetical protein
MGAKAQLDLRNWLAQPEGAHRARPTVVRNPDDQAFAPSPAMALQQALEAEFSAQPQRKWPPVATLGFVLATCGGFWTLFGLAVARIF